MRLIEQLTAVLAQVTRLAGKGQYQAAYEVTDDALHQLVGLSSDSIVRLETVDLLNQLKLQEPVDWAEAAIFIAVLLNQEAELYAVQERPDEADGRYLKAMQLLLAALNSGEEILLPAATPTIDSLADKLAGVTLPPATNAALLHHYEQTGQYARAEDSLFDWLDADPTMETVNAGLTFYARLQQKGNAELEAGNLPRDEVEAGLAELKTYL